MWAQISHLWEYYCIVHINCVFDTGLCSLWEFFLNSCSFILAWIFQISPFLQICEASGWLVGGTAKLIGNRVCEKDLLMVTLLPGNSHTDAATL